MGKDSEIEWTHHTFNPWWGCSKVSPACKNCYAETWAKRVGQNVWGEGSERRFFGEKHWGEPLIWNRAAEAAKQRARVFCASMADVFEDRSDLDQERLKLWTEEDRGQVSYIDREDRGQVSNVDRSLPRECYSQRSHTLPQRCIFTESWFCTETKQMEDRGQVSNVDRSLPALRLQSAISHASAKVHFHRILVLHGNETCVAEL